MRKRSNMSMMLRLMLLVKPLGGIMILAIVAGLVGNLAASAITILGAYGLWSVLRENSGSMLNIIFTALIICALLRGVLRYAEQLANHYIAFKLLAHIRETVFRALRRLAPAKLEGKDKGNLVAVVTADIELLELFYAHTISPVVIAVLFSLAFTIFIGRFHSLLGLVAFLAYVTIGLIVPVLMSKRSAGQGRNVREQSGELSSFVLDSLRGLSEILQFNQGGRRLREMERKTDRLIAEEAKMKKVTGSNVAVSNSLIFIFDIAILALGTVLYRMAAISFGALLIATISLMSSFGPVIALANLGSGLQRTFASAERIFSILDESPAVDEVRDDTRLTFSGAQVKAVSFSYTGSDPGSLKQPRSDEKTRENMDPVDIEVLKTVSLDIPANEILGIVGPSGSGKSTLLKLLMRFWDVDEGEIQISSHPIQAIATRNLRQMQGYVTQETHLFQDTIANNLKLAKQDATPEELEAACRAASVHDFIMSLPKGYESKVGELGDTLSGGERQRIGLARAFLHGAPLLLLDEPTSNLDSLNEAVILRSLLLGRNDKTIVLVSHRRSTMRIADRVISMREGILSHAKDEIC